MLPIVFARRPPAGGTPRNKFSPNAGSVSTERPSTIFPGLISALPVDASRGPKKDIELVGPEKFSVASRVFCSKNRSRSVNNDAAGDEFKAAEASTIVRKCERSIICCSFVPKRDNRVEVRGSRRWIKAEDNPDRHADSHRQDQAGRRNDSVHAGHMSDQRRNQ